jgi:hypothetical protein
MFIIHFSGGRCLDIARISIKEISKFVRNEMEKAKTAEDWVHGLPHVRRVYSNLELLLKCNEGSCLPLDPLMIMRLKIAVIFHDVKRSGPGKGGNHAVEGAEFFKTLRIDGLDEEDVKAIAFAIANHNVGLRNLKPEISEKATEDEKTLLGLLVLLDGMDTLCHIGYFRILQWYGQKGEPFSLLGNIPANVLRDIMGFKLSKKKVGSLCLKDNGQILPHLVHDFYIFMEMLEPVEHMLPSDYLEEIGRRWHKLEDDINKLIKMKEKEERPIKPFNERKGRETDKTF